MRDAVPRFTTHRFIARPAYRAVFLVVPEQEEIAGPRLRGWLSLQKQGIGDGLPRRIRKNLCRWCAAARRKPWRNEKDFRGNSSGMWTYPADRLCMETTRPVHKYDVRHVLARFLYGFLD